MGQMSDDKDLAHPFFSHMGMPHEPGTFSLRLSALATQTDGKTKGDFAFHFETGLSKFIGLHIRNDRFLQESHTEIMFQFAAIKSKDGMSGFSPIIEFEIPTKKGATRKIPLLVFPPQLSGHILLLISHFIITHMMIRLKVKLRWFLKRAKEYFLLLKF